MERCAILVDPFSSGQFLPDEFKSRGVACIAVLSHGIPANFVSSYHPEKFIEIIFHDGDMAALIARVAPFAPLCAIAGLETGVALADSLARALGLPGNDPATSFMRYDKYDMQDALARAGIRSARQHRATDVGGARAWLEDQVEWPVIVKPAMSAGSDSVYVCATVAQALDAVTTIVGATNLLGQVNAAAVLQEYLVGREWVVDTVSCNGQHVVTNVTRYLKVVTDCARVIYQHSEYMSPEREGLRDMLAYALGVNDALGIRYGAAHHEIIATPSGPTLVETNARMHGGDATMALRWCSPVTQVDLSVDAFIDAAAFAHKARRTFDYSHCLVAHCLISARPGQVTFVAPDSVLRQIPSFKLGHMPTLGAHLPKTVSLTTCPGYLWLLHTDADAVWRDQQRLIAMEQAGDLYRIA